MFVDVIWLYFFLLLIVFKLTIDKLLHEFRFHHFDASFALFVLLAVDVITPFEFLFLDALFTDNSVYVNSCS